MERLSSSLNPTPHPAPFVPILEKKKSIEEQARWLGLRPN